MKFLLKKLFLLVLMFYVTSIPYGFAQSDLPGDSITPSRIVETVLQGEWFDRELLYESVMGGDYTVRFVRFVLNEKGTYDFVYENLPSFLSVTVSRVQLEKGENFQFRLQGQIPQDLPDQDLQLLVLVRRDLDAGAAVAQTFQLTSKVLIRVGKLALADIQGETVGDLEITRVEDGRIDRLGVGYKNIGQRFFSVQPELELFSSDGNSEKLMLGIPFQLIPDQRFDVYVLSYEEEDYVVPESISKAVFSLYSEPGEILYSQEVPLEPQDVFVSYSPKLEYQGRPFRLTGVFIWTEWIGYYILILLGLCLLGYGFYHPKVKT